MIDIAVFFGGCSSEYGVSLQSACGVINALDKRKYNVLKIWITREGKWFLYQGDTDEIAADSRDEKLSFPVILPQNKDKKKILVLKDGKHEEIKIDLAFPVMHGKNGEDGTLQGLLQLAGIPAAGCGTLSSAHCMDKYRAHKIAAAEGIAVPKTVLISSIEEKEKAERFAAETGYPVFVKPLRAGSSFGISKVFSSEQLFSSLQSAFSFDSAAVIEENIDGFEAGCAVVGSRRLIFGAVDMITLCGGFFDYNEKYTLGTAKITVPAPLDDETAEAVRQTAGRIYRALDCEGFARVDMFVKKDGGIVFNEVNTIPGFTPHSRFPKMMEAAGYSMTETLDLIIKEALK